MFKGMQSYTYKLPVFWGIRKKLDPLDTYVPTVVLAQLQFEDVSMYICPLPEYASCVHYEETTLCEVNSL